MLPQNVAAWIYSESDDGVRVWMPGCGYLERGLSRSVLDTGTRP